jgi:hypothetical protein
MVEALQSIQVPQVQFANVPVTGRNTVTSRVEALRKANEHIVRQNRGGLQDFSVTPGGGERIFKTSAIDNALAGTGLGSIIGTNLQDKLDPKREQNTATGLLGWLQQVGEYSRSLIDQDRRNRIGGAGFDQIPGLAQGVLGWIISSPLNTDITPEKRRENEAWEQEGWQKWRDTGGLDQLTNNTVAETPTGQLTLEQYGSVFDPSRGYYGDAGKNPLLSPLIYLLNLPENILMGLVYDTADALGGDKSKSWDNRTRTLGALAGRDWGVSNRWSEERYIALQEPAGKVAGDRTGNPYWDLPENIAKTFGQSESGAFSKNIHIALQTIPAMVGEVITGGVADLGVGGLLKLPGKVGDVTSLGRQLDDLQATVPNIDLPGVRKGADEAVPHTSVVSGNSIEVPTPNVDPVVGDPVVVRVNTRPILRPETPPDAPAVPDLNTAAPEPELPKIEVGDGQVVKVKDIPSGRRVSDTVVEGVTTPKVEVPPSAENLVRRPLSDVEGTELARRQGIIEPEFKRTLSEGELAELARQQGRLFDGQTTMHPDYPRASYVTLEDGTVREIVLNNTSKALIKEGLPTVDVLVNLRRELDDLSKQYTVSPGEDKLERLLELYRKRNEASLRHAAEPAESAYTTRLLENELPSTQESFSTTAKIVGNDMVSVERALTSQRVVVEQLIQEVDEIKVVRNQLEETAPTIKPVGRQSVEEALGTYEVYSGQDVPEMGFKVSEADQYADLAGAGFNPAKATNSMDDWLIGKLPPTEFAKQNSEMTLWYHGTSSSVPIPDMDILKGATPSEYGLGVYLTKNENVADQAALALPQINRPPRPESVDTVPVRYTVDTSRVTRLFDLDAPMPKDIDELFYQTTVSIFGKNVADDAFRQSTTNVKLRQAWDSVRDSVYNVAGSPASEKQIREFQQIILEGFKERDVQAGLLKNGDNPVLVVYNPKLLTTSNVPQKLPAPPYIKQFEARGWLDKLTRQTEPSNSNIHNAMQSNLDYAEQATREAAENLAVELNRQKEMLEEYIVKKDNLETIVRKEQKETVRQLEATGDTVEAVRSVVQNDLVESAKTRRQRATQTSEAKDYSVPKAKRGKNPPAVSDKPISDDALPKRKRTKKPKPEDSPVDPIRKAKEEEISKLWKQFDGAKLRDNKALEDEVIQKIGFAYEAYRKDLTDLSIDDLYKLLEGNGIKNANERELIKKIITQKYRVGKVDKVNLIDSPARTSRFGELISTLESNQVVEQSNLVDLLTVATRLEPDNKDFQRASELAKQGKTVDVPPTKPRKLGDIISDLEGTQARGIKVDAEMYGKVAEAYVKKYGYTDDLSNTLPDATVSSGKSLGASAQADLSETLKPDTRQVVEVEIGDLWEQYESAKLANNESEKSRILDLIDDKYESIRVEKTEVSLGLSKGFFKEDDVEESVDQLVEQLDEVSDELFDRIEENLDKAPKDDAVVERLSEEIDDLWKQYESATSVEKTRILKELEGKSDELIRRTDAGQPELKPEPEAVPVEVVVEPIGVPLEGKRVPLGDRIRAEADKIREATKQEAEALVKILDNAGKISENYENLVTEVSRMVQDDLDEAALKLGTSESVPSFKVKAGTQKADIKDWQAAGQAGVYKFGDKTEFNLKYGKTEEAMDKFTVDAGKTGLDLNFVENTFVNQRNFQNILDGKNPVFDHNPFPEWVPSTGELTDYYDWTDYAKQYTKEKYTINNELPTKNTPNGGGVAGYKGEFVDLGSSKLFQDRQDEFLIKYADAKTSDGASVPSEMLENTHWNLESFKRLKQGKKPLGNYNGNPVTEWVPSTGELKAYKSWDDYADQYSVSKYTSGPTKAPVSPKVKATKTDKMVDDLLKDWDDIDLDDVRSANKQAKKFAVPELDDPCL